MLTEPEIERYSRQILLPEIGKKGQERLKASSAGIVGLGGLGSPAALYLAYAGIGRIRLIDRDRVDLSNLNRQTLHTPSDIGRPKVQSAKDKLLKSNPQVHIEPMEGELNTKNAHNLLGGLDVVLDCLDNLPSRLLINEACFRLGTPFVHAAIHGFDGEISVFSPGETACYACYLGARRPPHSLTPFPVIGTTPGFFGVLQALEGIKRLLGLPSPVKGSMLLVRTLNFETFRIPIKKQTDCMVCQRSVPNGTIISKIP